MAVKLGWAYKDTKGNPTRKRANNKPNDKQREQLNKEVTPETGSDVKVRGMRKGIWEGGHKSSRGVTEITQKIEWVEEEALFISHF